MLRGSLFPFAALVLLAACNTAPSREAPPTPSAPSPPISTIPKPSPSASVTHFGEAISAPEVALSDVAKDPTKFANLAFATHGTVSAVCQEMGCWMEIQDSGSGAHLRMHGHSFFVPRTAGGKTARVQATIVPAGAPKACAGEADCAGTGLAQLQLDATGVELD